MYYHYLQHQFSNNPINQRPPSLITYVEGKPGTGKSFVTQTLRNITRLLTQRNSSDMASAPTGCAAALIDGTTHYRSCSIPAGKQFQSAPTNLKASNPENVRAMRKQCCKVILRLMDEHSMSGRAMWAWLRHRSKEMRRPTQILDDDGKVLFQEASFSKNMGWFPIPI